MEAKMTESNKWLNKTCPLFGCADRLEQARLKEELNVTKSEKEDIYREMQKIKQLVSGGALSLQQVIESVLDNRTDIDKVKLEALKEKLEKVFSSERIAEMINQNLNSRKELHEKEMMLRDRDIAIRSLKQEVVLREQTLKDRERKEIDQIKEFSNMDKQHEDLGKANKALRWDKERLGSEVKALEEFKQERLQEITKLKEQHESLNNNYKVFTTQIKALREEFMLYRGFKTKNINRARRLVRKVVRLDKKGKTEKALKCWLELKILFETMMGYERITIADEFEAARTVMEK